VGVEDGVPVGLGAAVGEGISVVFGSGTVAVTAAGSARGVEDEMVVGVLSRVFEDTRVGET
jgi:hypothetical protein